MRGGVETQGRQTKAKTTRATMQIANDGLGLASHEGSAAFKVQFVNFLRDPAERLLPHKRETNTEQQTAASTGIVLVFATS